MKKILIILGLIVIMANVSYAQDRYFVEVDIVTKENKSDYILKDGDELEKLSADRVLIEFATLEEYMEACAGATWETKWTNWKKTQANQDKVDTAIAVKIAEVNLSEKIEIQKELNAVNELLKISIGAEATELQKQKAELESKL